MAVSQQGILFSDIFINNKKIFVDFFSQYYIKNQTKIDTVANKLFVVLKKYTTQTVTPSMAEEFQSAWEEFEKYVLLNNKDLDLIVSYRGADGSSSTFSQIIPQKMVEGTVQTQYGKRYGIESGNQLIKDSMAQLKATEVEKFLQEHLQGLLNQLEKPIVKNEAFLIHKYHSNFLSKEFQAKGKHLTNKKFREVFYSQNASFYFGGQGMGQVYDAFMNHIADKKQEVYTYLRFNGLVKDMRSLQKSSGTVYTEEGEVEKGANFPKLLSDSRNKIGWYTGGDILIINPKTMDIVYNIQLKTTGKNVQSVFGEKISAMREFIIAFVNDTPEEKGERIFTFFSTSVSNHTEFNNVLQKDIDKILTTRFQQIILTI